MAPVVDRGRVPVFTERAVMFTDIEGSTERWDADPNAMRALLAHHDAVIGSVVAAHDGVVAKRTGDGAIALFDATLDAARGALDLHRRVAEGPVECELDVAPLRIRIGIHRGVIEVRDGDFFGPPMHRAARVMSAGQGGQVVVSRAVADQLAPTIAESVSSTEDEMLSLIDCGFHRLKGFREPEHLSLLVPGAAATALYRLRTETTEEGWLPPTDASTFVGRERELSELPALLVPGRILTLVGPGGVGKTRLAVQVAERARAAFPDGAWFVDLAAVTEPTRVLSAIADVLSVTDEKAVSLIAPLRQALSSRRLLLVLDNCEHVLDSVVDGLRTVLSDRSSAALLCTSQRDLGIEGEVVVSIEPLGFQDDVATSPAGRLFLQQAKRADPAFVLDERTASAVRRICHRLEGLPLAIELAASRVRVMSTEDIADRLGTTLDLLRSRDHPDRQRTVAATIGWSLGLLTPEDRDLILDVSVFNSTFSWAAAAAVSGHDELDVLDGLEELARRSLVVRIGREFRMLVPLRLYCGEQLAGTDRAEEVRGRHAAWVSGHVPRPLDDLDAVLVNARLDEMVATIEDLHAAHRWFLAHDPAQAAALALELVDVWITRGRCQEAMEWLASCDVDDVPTELRVEVLGWIAGFGWTVGRNDDGEDAARRALDLADRAELSMPVLAATRLAVRLAFSNRTSEAVHLARAAEREVRSGRGDASRVLGPLGVVMGVNGDADRAIQLTDEAVASARQVGVLRLLGALANRVLVGSDEDGGLADELEALARAVGRASALAHAISARARRSLRNGDLPSFLSGLSEFADLMVNDEPTAVVGTLQLVVDPVTGDYPREAAVMLGAVETLSEWYDHRGTDVELTERRRVTGRLEGALGDAEFARAIAEGRAMTLGHAVDLLHWLADEAMSAATTDSTS